jgi:23S rRNA pseudouridine1911/1915/1917 synthase
MASLSLEILWEDNHCLAIVKPGGYLSTHYEGKEETLDRRVKQYLREKYKKPGNVFLGIVHRLDRPVSGVLLFARTSKAAARLAEQFRRGEVQKIYWAVTEGGSNEPVGTLEDWLKKNKATGRVEVVDLQSPEARHAILQFQTRSRHDGLSFLEIHPRTGRRHQIRAQLAHRGHPIYGDTKYGSAHRFGQAIALHARSLTFMHPVRQEPITLTAELPTAWRERFAHLLPKDLL